MTDAEKMILQTRLSNEALSAMIVFGRVAKRVDCPDSHRRHGGLTTRCMLNLIRAGVAEYHDTGAISLTDLGIELAVSMKDEPFGRYARKRPGRL